jgi:hypothetical protein
MADTAIQKALDLGVLKNKAWIKNFNSANSFQKRIAWLRNYNVQTKDEEAIIQLLVDKFDPPKASVTKVSQVRKEMELLEAKGQKIDNPKDEAMWQAKLDEAAALDKVEQQAVLDQHMAEIQKLFPDLDISMFLPSGPVHISVAHPLEAEKKSEPINVGSPAAQTFKDEKIVPTPLERLEGLTVASQDKLKAAGVNDVEAFFALGYKKALEILQSEVVVSRFKNRFKTDPGTLI